MAAGGGYFALPNLRLYDIPPSTPMLNRTDNAEQYGTAIIYNLQCLVCFCKAQPHLDVLTFPTQTSIRRAVIKSGKSYQLSHSKLTESASVALS